tara:strand:- start:11939 stop:14449 length:2511 start_codon:yes stop_codon:yes gene_type:complete
MSKVLDKEKFRLPNLARPIRYEIHLLPNLENQVFKGTVNIELSILENTSYISLNVADIEILDMSFEKDSEKISNWEIDEDYEILKINFKDIIPIGKYNLFIKYNGILNDKLRGFYHSSFTDDKGQIQSIATTQFESTDARRAFPCFDEPDYKAVFSVKLSVEKNQFCLSNAEIKNQNEDEKNNIKIVEFEDTIPMSTYLVAFVIGPFEASKAVNVDGINLRIIYPKGKGHLCDFALELGEYALRYFSNYYKIPYPGDKLDMVAIPDFAFGAMENLGCITYREALLLVDKKQATSNELIRIADVICHEIAHMWFGDLVTMKWWNGIWLNEAFATFMATKAVADYNTDWDRWAQFSLEKSMAMDIDSLSTTRAIEYPVISPSDADGMFDLITYEKGGSILRMLEQFLGEDAFRQGVSDYLTKHSFSNTETDDLWNALEESSNLPVKSMMDTWIFQPGHPVISYDVNGKNLILNQSVFKYLNNSDSELIWSVPLFIKYKHKSSIEYEKYLLGNEKSEIKLKSQTKEIFLNANAYGFYKVNNNFENSFNNIDEFSSEEKYSMIDDYWSMVLSGSKNTDEFLNFSSMFIKETDPDILTLLYSCFSSINRVIENKTNLQSIVRPIFENSFEALDKIKNRSTREIQSLATSLRALSILINDDSKISLSKQIFKDFTENKSLNYEPDIVSSAISITAHFGNTETFNNYLELMENAKTPQDEVRFQRALVIFREESQIKKVYKLILEDKIRTQDAPYLLAGALNNESNGWLTWQFITKNWDILTKKFPENSIVRMLSGIRSLNHREYLDEINNFFNQKERISQGKLQLEQHLEKLEINVNLRERN